MALGSYPDVSLEAARKKHQLARELLADDIDPMEQRKEEKLAEARANKDSFEAVARAYVDKQANVWTQKHADNFLRRLEADIFPTIGAKPIRKLEASPQEVLAAIKTAEERGAYDLAHRLMQMVNAVFRYGVANSFCGANPLRDIEPREVLTPHKAQHMKTIKPQELPELLEKIEGYDGDDQTRLGLKLVCRTFVRTNELTGMQWAEINLKTRRWEIPARRMKMRRPHFVPHSEQSVAILEELQDINGESKYVFAGRNRRDPMSNNTLLYVLYRLGYMGRLTTHGIRSVASTVLNEAYQPQTHEWY
jgi:integrase